MPLTALQTILHSLQEGVAVNVDLKDHMSTPGDTFKIVSTSRAYNEADLPDGLTMSSSGVISGTPAVGSSSGGARGDGVYGVRVRAEKGSRDPDASWQARIAGAHAYERFEFDGTSGAANPSGGWVEDRYENWERDSTYFRSGGFSLHQWLPPQTGWTTGQSVFKMPTKHPRPTPWQAVTGQGLDPDVNEKFYVTYSLRCNRNFVLFPWEATPKMFALTMLPTVGPATEDNFTESYSAGIWQTFATFRAGFPLGLQYNGPNSGDDMTVGPQGPYSDYHYHNEVDRSPVVLNGLDPGFFDGNGQDASWTARQDYRFQEGNTYDYVSRNGSPDGRPDPIQGGPFVPIDDWFTFKVEATAGVPGTTSSRLRFYIAQNGQDYVLCGDTGLFDQDGSATKPYWTDSGTGETNYIWSCLFIWNQTFGTENPTKDVQTDWWLDECIVSPNDIPAPDFDGTGSYRTKDAIITMRVSP